MTKEDLHPNCPLAPVDRRLDDVHRQWHEAEAAYFDPDAFRVAIQTAIQTLRTVTFILQSNKRQIPEFDKWYEGWRTKLAADPLMRWMVDARNKIEKQGDLEARSMVKAEVIVSYLEEGPIVEVPANLFDPIKSLLASIPRSDFGRHVLENGALRIERRWVENTLPDYELLEAVAEAYGKISNLVADAHRQAGLSAPSTLHAETGTTTPQLADGRMPCMVAHADRRAIIVSLKDGAPVSLDKVEVAFDEPAGIDAAKRYELSPDQIFTRSDNLEEQLRTLFVAARTVIEKDGEHITIMFLFRQGKPAEIIRMETANQGQKYLLMRELGQEVARSGADAAILIGEIWSAPLDRERPYLRAAESENRKEFLRATLVRKDGEPLNLWAEIHRSGDTLTLGETLEITGGAQFMFAPLYKVWGKDIPKEWIASMRPSRPAN